MPTLLRMVLGGPKSRLRAGWGWPSGIRPGRAGDGEAGQDCGQGAGRLGLQQLGAAPRFGHCPPVPRCPPEPDDGRRELSFQAGQGAGDVLARSGVRGLAGRGLGVCGCTERPPRCLERCPGLPDVEQAVVGLQGSMCHEGLLRPLVCAGAGLDIGLAPEDRHDRGSQAPRQQHQDHHAVRPAERVTLPNTRPADLDSRR
jgi:hypothetical protein